MYDSQGTPMDRSSRNDYEARATAVQQHIRHLVDELQRLRDMAQRLLRTHISSYLRASREWDDAVTAFNLREDRSSWAQTMLQQRTLFFHGLSLSPMSLDFQLAQLLKDYMSILDDIEAFIRSDSSPADAHSAAIPAAAHSAANGITAPAATHPVANGTVHGSNTFAAAHPAVNKDRRTSAAAMRRSSSGIRPVPATQVYRNDRPHGASTQTAARDVPRSTTHRSAAASTPARQSSTRPSSSGRVPTFVNSSMRQGSSTAGIMAQADGDISHAIPLAWQPTIDSGPVPSHGHGSARLHGSVPSRTVVPEHNRRLQQVMLTCATQGHGHNTAPTRPLTVGADGKPLYASSDAQATFSAPADYGVDFGLENSSAFYRNATFSSRDASTGIAPPTLVLKEIPLTPFDGDIRRYPSFRNRFLEIVEAHRNLEPRHKLQYLLQFLRGEPLRLAEGFPITDTSYFHVINELERRYGNTQRIRKALTTDLLNVSPPGRSTASLRQFYDQVSRVNAELQQLGTDASNSDFLTDILMDKLSAEHRLAVVKDADYQSQKTVSSVLRALRVHLHMLEEAADAGFDWCSQPNGATTTLWSRPPGRFGSNTYSGNNRSNATGTAFTYIADATDTSCAFCSSHVHDAADCNVYATVPARLRRLRELKRCFLCLQEGHRNRSCPRRPAPPLQLAGRDAYHRALCASPVHPDPMDNNNTCSRGVSQDGPTTTREGTACNR
ncbi:Pao retrotransposon peptidase family protein-like, partial [Aphelenchoides avenae]